MCGSTKRDNCPREQQKYICIEEEKEKERL